MNIFILNLLIKLTNSIRMYDMYRTHIDLLKCESWSDPPANNNNNNNNNKKYKR